ncbi:hypothetical protein PQI66_12335 [Corynebacterium sp. USCH3]|uniref:hypothetical protein n=1 Tax=Corynebacterium sp. USCH3 TaxID=3024840 RepID=UPI00309D95E7
MDLSTEFTLPFVLGGTIDENAARCVDHFININEKSFGSDFEAFIDVVGADGNGDLDQEPERITAMIRDGRCVTVRLDGPDASGWTFLGLDIDSLTTDLLMTGLEARGIKAVSQYNGVALPDHFVVVDPGDSITWWDPNYWGRDGFLESAVAMP